MKGKNCGPRGRRCAWCGGPVICSSAANWGYKCRDYRPGGHYGKVVVFCSWECLRKFEAEYGPKKERLVLK